MPQVKWVTFPLITIKCLACGFTDDLPGESGRELERYVNKDKCPSCGSVDIEGKGLRHVKVDVKEFEKATGIKVR